MNRPLFALAQKDYPDKTKWYCRNCERVTQIIWAFDYGFCKECEQDYEDYGYPHCPECGCNKMTTPEDQPLKYTDERSVFSMDCYDAREWVEHWQCFACNSEFEYANGNC